MSPALRKFALTVHITTSVGWLGAVAAFLALAVVGLTSADAQLVRAAYLAIAVTTWTVIVPLSLAALGTGLVESLGTSWGLLRHHWVVAKLVLTVVATAVLLVKTAPIRAVARAAARATLSPTDLRGLRTELVVHAGGGLAVLLVIATLSVYKPKGLTRVGRAAAARANR
ncbi:MAG TPA: hypothetical protein VGD56_07365 [Gemmatirosa sp.]